MKLGELLDIVRIELDDVAGPAYLWSDSELIEYANDAQNEAARRGRLFVDSTTSAICSITLVPGTSAYALDPRVIRVNRAIVSGESRPLGFVMLRDLDDRLPGWESMEETPTIICPDYETGKIRLVGTPTASGTLKLTVVRLPLAAMNDLQDAIEIREEYQRNLRHWIEYRAYMKRDSETFKPDKAQECLGLFTAEFGPARPAYDEQWMNQHYMNDGWNGRY